MTDEQQLKKFRKAVDEKNASDEETQAPSEDTIEQDPLVEHGRPQDVRDPRAKNSGHGKKTADKWNQ
jgi:hypothetical protein